MSGWITDMTNLKLTKTLKQEGVPFGARWLFRAQYGWLMLMIVCLLLTTPLVALWCLLHDSGIDFVDGVAQVLQDRLESIKSHRVRIVRLYGDTP